MAEVRYDAIVIGAGQAGVPLSICLAVEANLRTALVERVHVGGTCVNEGCTPTKTMVASARVAYLARRAREYGVQAGPVTVDMAQVRRRTRDIVTRWREGSERRIRRTENLDLLMGEAWFVGPKTVEVRLRDGGSSRLTADRIFINTGARPAPPPLPGLDRVPYLDSTTMLDLEILPEHLLVLGGGYVGVEFGQMFRRFGSAVTILHRSAQLLSREDRDVAEEVAKILREDDIAVLLDTRADRVEQGADGAIRLVVSGPAGKQVLTASHLLVATGRAPNTEGLNLPAGGVETDEWGFIRVNDRLETSAEGIFALGDVNGGPAFTHISYDDFRIIRNNLLRGMDDRISGRPIPYTIYIDPQLGRVGLTEHQAAQRGRLVRVAKLPMSHVARAIESAETRGFMKAIVDADTDQILGCAILGMEGGEIMSIVQLAIMGKVPYTTLRDTIFAHPTLAEALNNLFLKWEKEPIEVLLSQAAYSASHMSAGDEAVSRTGGDGHPT